MVLFTVTDVWDLGETIHVIGTVRDGSISPGATLHDSYDSSLVLNVASIALGGRKLPSGTVTLVVEKLPCDAKVLTGRVFQKEET